jgi:hypothetical protein
MPGTLAARSPLPHWQALARSGSPLPLGEGLGVGAFCENVPSSTGSGAGFWRGGKGFRWAGGIENGDTQQVGHIGTKRRGQSPHHVGLRVFLAVFEVSDGLAA